MLILPTCHLLQVFYMLFRDPYSTKVQKNFVILAVEGRWSGLRWTAMRCRTSPDETRSGGFTSRSRARRTRRSPPAASSRRIQIRTRRTRTTISPCIRPCRCSRQRYVRHYMYQFAWSARLDQFCQILSEASGCEKGLKNVFWKFPLLTWAAQQLQYIPTASGTLIKHFTKPFSQPDTPDCI